MFVAAPARRAAGASGRGARAGAIRWRIAAALGAVLSLAGCSHNASNGVELQLWAMGAEGEVLQQLVPEFERRNPDIHVRVQQVPWTAAHEKLLTAYVGESTPDVSQLGNTWVPEFTALGALEPLDPWVAATPGFPKADFFPGIWATNVIDGTTYGLPWYVDTRVMFYRTDLLARAGYAAPPTTWAQWLDAMRKVRALGAPTRWGALFPLDEWAQPVILALQEGSPILRDGGRYGAFTDSAFRRAFEYYVQIFRDSLAPPFANTQVANLYQEFSNGTFAMYVSGPWNIGEFKRRVPAALQRDWMTAPLPGPTGASSAVSIAGGSSLVIYRASRHKAEAWKLVQYLSEPAQQVRFYQLTGDLPARATAWRDTVIANDRYTRAFYAQLQRVVPLPQVPEWELIATDIASAAESAARGRQTVDAALTGLQRDVDQVLEKRRWMLARRGSSVAATGAR